MDDFIESANKDHLSYLRARDPSILTGNRGTCFKRLQVNLATERLQEESSVEDETTSEQPRHIQIYLRVKNVNSLGNLYRIEDNIIYCSVPEGAHGSRNVKHGQYINRSYTFSHIFGPPTTQDEVFNHTVKPRLLDLLNGKNSTLMTYGASGSGKTFTIVGTAADPGVIPRALEYLFGSLPQLCEYPRVKPTPTGGVTILTKMLSDTEKNARNMLLTTLSATIDKQHIHTYQQMQQRLSSEPVAEIERYKDVSMAVWVSFAEIYNEQVYDLLAPEPIKGKQRIKLHLGKCNEKTYIKNLTNISVSNGLEAYQILQYGLHNLKYAATAINSHSSRSHCIFTIKLVQALEDEQGGYYISHFNFCDLAGSERSKKTLNAGDRLKESNNINTSLMVLARCINRLRDSQFKNDASALIPFRDSKLTMLFQTALSGKEDIAMIVNINPSPSMFDETMHVLNFSAVAKQISIKNIERKDVKSQKQQPDKTAEAYNNLVEEHAKLKEAFTEFYNDSENERIKLSENAAEVAAGYRKILADMENDWKARLAALEKIHKEEIENLKDESENKFCPDPKRFKGVINVDSDSDDEQNLPCRCSELNTKLNVLQAQLTKCKFNCQTLESKITELEEENIKLKQEINEMNVQSESEINILPEPEVKLNSEINMLSEAEENMLSEPEENILSESEENILSEPEENVISELEENILSEPEKNILSEPMKNILSESEENILLECDTIMLSEPDEDNEEIALKY